MTVRCIDCRNYKMSTSPRKMLGLFLCANGPAWEYPSPYHDRECAMFEQAEADVVAKRVEFLKPEPAMRKPGHL